MLRVVVEDLVSLNLREEPLGPRGQLMLMVSALVASSLVISWIQYL